jgi:uncharacterized BrkB/YihY/UPF0761 family membrane protein
LWVYYSAQILFFGAEITKVYANRFGRHPQPASYARWVSGPKEVPRPDLRPTKTPRALETHPERQARLISELKEEVETLRGIVRQ